MGNSIKPELSAILNDKYSGSTELLDNLNTWFSYNYSNEIPSSQIILEISEKLKPFQSIQNYLEQLQTLFNNNDLSVLHKFYDDFRLSVHKTDEELFTKSLCYIKDMSSFVTISNSYQVLSVLKKLYNQNNLIRVTICESRPLFEGRIFAERLLKHGISTSIITEAMIPKFVKNSDCVFIGADKILSDGSIVNKVGSKLLAICAKHYNKPLFILADKSKWTRYKSIEQNKFPKSEIWDTENNIVIENFYFEQVEASLVTQIITN